MTYDCLIIDDEKLLADSTAEYFNLFGVKSAVAYSASDCREFLKDFEHVSIKMPKVQGLSLNPTKISGLCGRLMCCLGYENAHYSETFRLMPRINSEVETPEGKGTVVYNNLLKRFVQVRIGKKDDPTSQILEFPLDKIKVKAKNNIGFDDDPGNKLKDLED